MTYKNDSAYDLNEIERPNLCRDHLASYLAKMGKVPLLTREQERDLTKKLAYHAENTKRAVLTLLPGAIYVAGMASELASFKDIEGVSEYFGTELKSAPKKLAALNAFLKEQASLLQSEGHNLNGTLDARFAANRPVFYADVLSLNPRIRAIEETIGHLEKYVPLFESADKRFETSVKLGEIPGQFLTGLQVAVFNYESYKKHRDHIFEANLRLVVKIAREYEGWARSTSYLGILDLIEAGNRGLLKGIERFDPKVGAKLSTYAAGWIKQTIKREICNSGKGIRKPVHHADGMFRINNAITKIQGDMEDFNYQPTPEEIEEVAGISAYKIRTKLLGDVSVTSLQSVIRHGDGDESDTMLGSLIEDPNSPDPRESSIYIAPGEFDAMIERLPQRERVILEMRFGLGEYRDNPHTLEEVGERFNITRERIRQLQNIALGKLRPVAEKRGLDTLLAKL